MKAGAGALVHLTQQVEGHADGPFVLLHELGPELVGAEVGERELGVVGEHEARFPRQLTEHVALVHPPHRFHAAIPHHGVVNVTEVRHLNVLRLDAALLPPRGVLELPCVHRGGRLGDDAGGNPADGRVAPARDGEMDEHAGRSRARRRGCPSAHPGAGHHREIGHDPGAVQLVCAIAG